MPRLRKPPEDKVEKVELPEVPIDKAVTITIGEDEKVQIEAINEAAQETDPIKAAATEPEKKVEQKDGSEDLKEQLRLAKEAQEAAQRAVESEKTARIQAERAVEQHKQEVTKFRTEAEQSNYDAIINAIGNAQSESDSASRDYEIALQNQDFKAAAESQKRLARAETRLVQLEDGKTALESRREAQKQDTRPIQTDPIEQAIAAFPHNAQVWLRRNSQYLTDDRKNAQIRVAHWAVLDSGVTAYSDAYFDKIEQELGLKQAPKSEKKETKEIKEPPARIVSAPPSRSSQANGLPSGSYSLTAAEREAARMSGISDTEYLRQKLRIEQEKGQIH